METTTRTIHEVRVSYTHEERPEVDEQGETFKITRVDLKYRKMNDGPWRLVEVDATGQMLGPRGGYGAIEYGRRSSRPELIAELITSHRPR